MLMTTLLQGRWLVLALLFGSGLLSAAPPALPLDSFMVDRPAAAELLRQHPGLEQSLRAQLSRPIGRSYFVWSNEPPYGGAQAQHIWSSTAGEDRVTIRISQRLVPADQLLALSFEAANAQGKPRFDALAARAAARQMTREEFIDGILMVEQDATRRMQETFPKLLPLSWWSRAHTEMYRRLMEVPADFPQFKTWSVRTRSQNYARARQSYGIIYDRLTAR
jgi:hypothetical protein